MIKSGLFILLMLFFCILSFSQNRRWFECVYYNVATDIKYAFNPYSTLPYPKKVGRLLIYVDDFEIAIFNENGVDRYYKGDPFSYGLDNGMKLKLYKGYNIERRYYEVGVTSPIGNMRNVYDSAIIIGTKQNANLYGVKYLHSMAPTLKNQNSIQTYSIDSVEIKIHSALASNLKSLKTILIRNGSKLIFNDISFDLTLFKFNDDYEHFLIDESGTELLIRKGLDVSSLSLSLSDGGLVRFLSFAK